MPECSELSPAICPRCGYDLDGIVQSWEGQWPLRGVCSECGLEFNWRDVFLAERLVLKGFFEHASGYRARLAWAWRTWLWALWPPLFWRKVGLRYPPRVRAIVVWPVFTIVLAWGLGAIIANASFLVFVTKGLSTWQTVGVNWGHFLVPWTAGFVVNDGSTLIWVVPDVPSISGPLAASVTIAVVLLCLPWTRATSHIRPGHVLRAFVYGLALLAFPLILAVPRVISDAAGFISEGMTGSRRRLPFLDNADLWARRYWYVALALLAAWLLIWWTTAIRTLFVGRQPGRILAAVHIPALLAFVIALVSSRDFIRTIGVR